MIQDKNRIFDGWLTLEGGVDAGRAPEALDPNQCQSAINMTFRGGNATTRPGIRKLVESLPDLPRQIFVYNQPFDSTLVHRVEGEYTGVEGAALVVNPAPPPEWIVPANLDPSEVVYRTGIMQCASAYSPHNGQDCIMAMIGGRLFRITPHVTTADVIEIEIENNGRADETQIPTPITLKAGKNLRNDKNQPIAYMVQADKWMVIQDGISSAIIYDGKKARRSNTTGTVDETEIPVGTILAYGMGRICTVVNKRDIAFGDLFGSHDTPDPADSLILFTERNFLAEGFDASIPFHQGIATGMAFFPQLDTSTGNGQLMVFAERGANSFFLNIDRELWKTSQFQILALATTGLRGDRSISAVNEDLWFRSDDGMRSYRQARSESSGWAHIPLSTNVKQYLGNDADFLLRYASSIYFDNRIICTTSPMWNQGRPSHMGLIVVDFDIISSFNGQAISQQVDRPAWEGFWFTPQFQPVQVLTGIFEGKTRAFCFGIDNSGQNQLYEFSVDDKDDFDDEKIPWQLTSRAFDFQKLQQGSSSIFNENEIYDADIWLRDIVE